MSKKDASILIRLLCLGITGLVVCVLGMILGRYLHWSDLFTDAVIIIGCFLAIVPQICRVDSLIASFEDEWEDDE